ncbi:low-density lipoprotein receptor-related protein 6 [Patella vulgata]|uniref:low-density lipoprotein receptor-related protein 6 n=1 Tax=Patella vulgata TaxID=6465 RepID=UPI002180837C|nr:low-density lipoprotein receptor-related protein 6 [Patella vulgata]
MAYSTRLLVLYGILAACNDVTSYPLLLFANRKDVRLINAADPKGNSTIIVNNQEDASAVDFLYNENSIFWTDVSEEVIKRTYLNDTQNSIGVITTGLVSPDGLACDWLGRKLYWTDSETNRIEVSNLDGSYRTVLFWQGLDQPRAIALDPLNGYMYWSDWGETPKIERAGMDGKHLTRKAIITENVYWPNGLTLDYDDSKIFWADGKLSYIHKCNFDGSDRRVVVEGSLPHPFALTLEGESLFWTDWKTHSIHMCDKKTGLQKSVVHDNIFSPMDIHVYTATRQPTGKNPCGNNNGGCSHLCLMSPIKPFYTCACPTGVLLKSDKKTCADGAENILFLARRTDLRRISLDTPDYTDVVLPLNDIRHAIAIDYDPVDGYVYWTDDEVEAIRRSLLDGTNQEAIVNTEVYHPDGIAVDWIARNLYWTDTGTDRIEVSRLNGTSRKVLISDNLDEPRALCLDPVAGYLYWSDWGEVPKIERAALDGSDRITLVDTDLGWPNGLTLDYDEQKIYWGDAKTDTIEVADLDGRNRRTVISENIPHIFGFSLLGDYVYWTDWQRRSIERVNKNTGKDREVIIDQLPDLMGLKAVYVKKIEGTNPCAVNNGGCSHLCLHRPLSKNPTCACPMGLELISNGRTCIIPDAFLLFTIKDDIKRISLEVNHNIQPIPIQGVKDAAAIDFDINDNRIYWTDIKVKSISRAFMNGSAVQHIIDFGVDFPEGMAVDWVAHNIYWADTGKQRIEVARLDGTSRKVLVWRDLTDPRALALDPPNGYMYWSVWGNEPHIERANLDGSKRKVLIADPGRVQDLTIDYIEKRMYWTNIDRERIESSDMLGENRKVVVRSNVKKPMGLTQYEDFIYWTDILGNSIECANKSTGNNRTVIHKDLKLVFDITVFHASRQSGWNSCGKNNGGCSHLCLAHSKDWANGSFHCACPTHYTLNEENTTCEAPKYYLLLSQKTAISRLVMEPDDADDADNPEVVLPIQSLKNIKALAYDPKDEFIYWIDGRNKVIKRAHDNGSKVEIVLHEEGIQPYDIAIDPYSRSLYWTCNKNNVINVTRLDRTPVGVVVRSGNMKPRSIALYPEKGYMYWTNMGSSAKIESAAMDGTERTTLFETNLEQPLALTVDKKMNKLCWADIAIHRIECADLGGGNRVVIVDEKVNTPRGIAIHGKYLYWLDRSLDVIERIDKSTRKNRRYVRGRMSGLSDLISVEHSLPAINHPCSNQNNACSHICLVAGNTDESRCSCPVNLVLKADETTCADPPTCPPDHFTCKKGDVHCIPLVWRCDKIRECEDNSDEEDCPKCTASEYQCANGECIAADKLCDGIRQCGDNSDENKCCKTNQFRCNNMQCIAKELKCNNVVDCTDESDEYRCPAPNVSNSTPTNTTHYAIAIVVGIVLLVMVIAFIFVCRRKTNHAPHEDHDIMMAKKPLNPHVEQTTPPHTLSSRGNKSLTTILSLGSGSGPPLYDRNHVTGASSSSSAVTQYPKETLNPPPSPVTDRSVYTGDFYCSLNSLSTVRSCRPKKPHKVRHNIPPPHTTPCSTDVCEDSEPYPGKKYYFNNSVVELSYDSDPYPPPPTPRSHYFSDEMSCPPSPSTERSFFNPYPPPPSPVAHSDC